MEEREPDAFLKVGLIIVDIPYMAGDGTAAKINQHIPDAHAEAVFAQRPGIGGFMRFTFCGSAIQILIGNQPDLMAEGAFQHPSYIQWKKGNPGIPQ